MKKTILYIFFLFETVNLSAQTTLNVMTFNIRLNLSSDSLNAWPYRKENLCSEILFHKADIIGVQEALPEQMNDMEILLRGYKYVGVGREDGNNKGEYSAIFYNAAKFEIIKSSTFWLSETPNAPGIKGWDAACARIITWAEMKFKQTGKSFFVFNTHFDHMGQVARRQSASMLLHAVDSIAGKTAAIVTGDFNAHPKDEPIQIITDRDNRLHLTDSKSVSENPHYGPTGTFNGFGPKEISDEPIDYIFLKGKVQVLEHATISESWNGRFASDHFAVLASLRL